MIHFLTQRFIENYDDYKNQKVRQAYGTLCSILSIICNIVLVIFKITIGLIVHSVAIQADGLNNLSDVGSNLASLFGLNLLINILIKIIPMVMDVMNILQEW